MTKKIQVSFSDKQIELIHKLKGELGDSESEVIRAIVTSWLISQGLISTVVKSKLLNKLPIESNVEIDKKRV